VSVIKTSNNTVVATVPVGTAPDRLAITSNGSDAYVANSGSDSVSVISTSTNRVVATVAIGDTSNGPSGVAITSDGSEAYVTDFYGGNVDVISTSTNTATTPVMGLDGDPGSIALT
jgi:YVTN family beta-propeller protein